MQKLDNSGAESGSFAPNERIVGVGVSRLLWDRVAAGFTARYLTSQLGDKTASGFAADAGLLARVAQWLSLGVSMENLNKGSLQYRETKEPLRAAVRYGASISGGKDFLLAVDYLDSRNSASSVHAGVEYVLKAGELVGVAARLGYSSRLRDSGLGGAAGLSSGIGLTVKGLTVQYAWSPYGVLGQTNSVSLGYSWKSGGSR